MCSKETELVDRAGSQSMLLAPFTNIEMNMPKSLIEGVQMLAAPAEKSVLEAS